MGCLGWLLITVLILLLGAGIGGWLVLPRIARREHGRLTAEIATLQRDRDGARQAQKTAEERLAIQNRAQAVELDRLQERVEHLKHELAQRDIHTQDANKWADRHRAQLSTHLSALKERLGLGEYSALDSQERLFIYQDYSTRYPEWFEADGALIDFYQVLSEGAEQRLGIASPPHVIRQEYERLVHPHRRVLKDPDHHTRAEREAAEVTKRRLDTALQVLYGDTPSHRADRDAAQAVEYHNRVRREAYDAARQRFYAL